MLEILKSINHNEFYLNRYIKFITSRKDRTTQFKGQLHHILPAQLFPEFDKNRQNLILLQEREHYIAHYILWKAFSDQKEMQCAFWFMTHTIENSMNQRIYEKLRLDIVANAKTRMSKTMKGKSTYVDSEGNRYHLKTDDPLISELNLLNISVGRKTSEETKRKQRKSKPIQQKTKDFFASTIAVKMPNGYIERVLKTDIRITTGDLKHFNTGTVNVIVDGMKKKVQLEEFGSGQYTHINKDMIDVFDPLLGRRTKVSKTDPRFISGEVYIKTSELTKQKASKAISAYNNSLTGGRWLIQPCGRKSKNFPITEIESMLTTGWKFGRILREDRIIAKPTLGKKWYTNGVKEISCFPGTEPEGFNPGKIQRAWITKGEETIQIPLQNLDQFLLDGWIRGRLKNLTQC